MKIQTMLFGILMGMLTAFSQENYGTWPYYKNITLNTSSSGSNVTGNVTKFPVLVRLGVADSLNGINAANIRFTKADGVTRLKHQLERFDTALQVAEAWVLVDTVYGNNSTQSIRMYWGKSGVADSSNASAVFDTANGFQAVWHLGEATNDTARDATVNKFSGTAATTGTAGNPFDTAGVIGKAKSFRVTTITSAAGTAGAYYAMTGTASSKLNFAEQAVYTISAWVRPYDIVNSGKIVSKGDRKYYLAKRNSGQSFEFAENQTGTGQNWWRVNSVANTWKYIVGVRTGGAGVAGGKEYVDAVVATTSGVSNNQATNSTFDVNIGRDPSQAGGAASYYFTGGIDEVTISNVARSADWIKLSFETQKPGATSVVKGITLVPGQEDYSTWAHHRDISVNTTPSVANVTGGVGHFPLLVRLTSAQSDVFTQSGGNGYDIRFTKSNGITRLPHQRERFDTANKVAEFWVLMDSVAGNADNRLRMYWGKNGANDSSNGAKVFDTANGFVSVSHLGDAAGISPRPNAVVGAPMAQLRNFPTSGYVAPRGAIGLADTLRKQSGGTFNSGTFGNVVGGDDYIELGRDANFNNNNYFNLNTGSPGTGLAVSLWVYDAGPVNVERLFNMAIDSNGAGPVPTASDRLVIMGNKAGLDFGNTTNLSIRYTTGTTAATAFDGANTFTPNAWHHVFVTKAGTTTTSAIDVYLDGALYGTTATTGYNNSGSVAHNFVFLGRTTDANPYFKGMFDELVIGKQSRSLDWIKLSYETQKPAASAVLLGPTDGVIVGIHSASAYSHNSGLSILRSGGGYLFRLPEGNGATVSVMDISGRILWSRQVSSGQRELFWDVKSSAQTTSGVYMVQLRMLGRDGKTVTESRTLAPLE